MQTLPQEIIEQIVPYISKITDKRQFTQTCKKYNTITYQLIKNQEYTIKIKGFKYTTEKCVEKFTLELCYDSYFNMIPISYLTPKNNVIVKALTIYGQIELLKQALCNGCKLFVENSENKYNTNSCAHAVISGNIKMLKFVRLYGCKWNDETFNLAVRCNHLDIVKFLKNYGCEMNDYAGDFAATNGNIIMLKWLIENGTKLLPSLCCRAAESGNLELLKILRGEYDCPWDYFTTSGAAQYGHLDVLYWCIDNWCEYKTSHIYMVASKNQQILSWMQHNCY